MVYKIVRTRELRVRFALSLAFFYSLLMLALPVHADESAEYKASLDPVHISELLREYGAVLGSETGDLMTDYPLKREDAVILLLRMMGAYDEAASYRVEDLSLKPYPFKDVKKDYYKPFILFAKDKSWIRGRSDGVFGFSDDVKGAEFAIMMLRALGYDPEYGVSIAEAKSKGLLDGTHIEADQKLIRGDAFIVMYNALMQKKQGSKQALVYELGYLKIDESKPLAVKSIGSNGLKIINVDFNSEVLKKSLPLVKIKRGKSSLAISQILLSDDYMSARFILKEELKRGDKVSVIVEPRKIEDDEDEDDFKSYELNVRTADDSADCLEYEGDFVIEDYTAPKIVGADFINARMLKIYASEPLNLEVLPILKDYEGLRVDGGSAPAMLVNIDGYAYTFFYTRPFDAGKHSVEVSGFKDYAKLDVDKATFEVDLLKDVAPPAIVSATDVTSKKIKIVFDEMLYKAGAFKVNGEDIPVAAQDEYDKRVVYLDLDDDTELTEESISGVKLEYRSQQDYADNRVASYEAYSFEARDDKKPPLAKIKEVNEDELTIVFNEPMMMDKGYFSLNAGDRGFNFNTLITPYNWISKDFSAIRLKLPILKSLKDTDFSITLKGFRDASVRHNEMPSTVLQFRTEK